MQEVTCFHCGYSVQITPDDERCSVCGTDLRKLITPEQASQYFYQRATELADDGDPHVALAEVERGLSVTRSVELHLLAAILAERVNDFQDMRKHVAAIPIDNPLRDEGEWLLRSHQARQREQRERRKRPQSWRESFSISKKTTQTPSYIPPELVEAYTAQDAFYTEQDLTHKRSARVDALRTQKERSAHTFMMGRTSTQRANNWRSMASSSFLPLLCFALLVGGSLLFLKYQPEVARLASQWFPSIGQSENSPVQPVPQNPVQSTVSAPTPTIFIEPTPTNQIIEEDLLVENLQPSIDLPIVTAPLTQTDIITESSLDVAEKTLEAPDDEPSVSIQEPTPTYELILRPTPRVRSFQGEPVADSSEVKAFYRQYFDLEGYLKAMGRSDLASLPVKARIEDSVLIIEGSVSQAEEREQLAIHTAAVPGVQKISVSNVRLQLPSIYIVQEGDSLWSIAKRIYGDSERSETLYQANREIMTTPNSLQVGMKLQVPSE